MAPTRDLHVNKVAETAAGLRSCTRRCGAAAAIKATSRSAKQVGFGPSANFLANAKKGLVSGGNADSIREAQGDRQGVEGASPLR
jgi:hypothetical protein